MKNKLNIKFQLYKHCVGYVRDHIEINRHAISEAQQAAQMETKNTAGDRYETELAMKQRETELFGKRLESALQQEQVLTSIDASKEYNSVQPGALVITSIGSFFIAVGADEITMDGEEYSLISIDSPICREMVNKRAGDSFLFRGKTIRIIDVF